LELNRALGKALKELRVRNGISQEQMGASQSYVSDVERGLKSISLEKLAEFSASIGVHPITVLARCYMLLDEQMSLENLITRVVEES
jgi:transcriptional regulator with XRE-family HTH domain